LKCWRCSPLLPPTGGLGLNSGLGDVHNLAYKLAAIHQGWGSSSLLGTYHSERRHVALVNSSQSVKNGKKIFRLLKTLGTTDSDVARARKNLFRTISDPDTKEELLRGIEDQRGHFDNLGLHIGYIYADTSIPSNASIYKPTFVADARLPHVWIKLSPSSSLVRLPTIDSSYVTEFTPAEVRGQGFSTLDLCAFDAFTLIADKTAAERWRVVVRGAAARLPEALKIDVAVLGQDFELLASRRAEEWVEKLHLKEGGRVLVRPDQLILETWMAETTSGDVRETLADHLGLREGDYSGRRA
jgi:hypothetical protein